LDHTGKDQHKDRNRNYRRTGWVPCSKKWRPWQSTYL